MNSLTRLRKQLMADLPPIISVPLHAWKHLRYGEPEIRHLQVLCDPSRAAYDVGANVGIYSYWLMRHSKVCHAFEANPHLAQRLARFAGNGPLKVWPVALSDVVGRTTLNVPVDPETGLERLGSASIVSHADFDSVVEIEVKQARLDDLDLPPCGFIKIDVEGFEMNVLKGAAERIARDRPNVLVEAEDRHRPAASADVIAWFRERDFAGFYLKDQRWHSVSTFDSARMQDVHNMGRRSEPGHVYVNNFLFVNDRTQAELQRRGLLA